jgi:transcriptional regulator NrdR family protein
MKCPLCHARTDIKEKRDVDGKVIRRRECYNYHVFSTEEVVITAPRAKRKYNVQKTNTHETRIP